MVSPFRWKIVCSGLLTEPAMDGISHSLFNRGLLFVSKRIAVACPSFVCLSVTFVHPTQPVAIFGNFSTPFGTLAIQ